MAFKREWVVMEKLIICKMPGIIILLPRSKERLIHGMPVSQPIIFGICFTDNWCAPWYGRNSGESQTLL